MENLQSVSKYDVQRFKEMIVNVHREIYRYSILEDMGEYMDLIQVVSKLDIEVSTELDKREENE